MLHQMPKRREISNQHHERTTTGITVQGLCKLVTNYVHLVLRARVLESREYFCMEFPTSLSSRW